jgi:hypothetical protein
MTDTEALAGRVWARIGLAEHASIASFARFVLQLLSVGAPPRLLHDAIRAMDDELRHAQLAFGIALQLTARPCGPARLDLTGALEGSLDPAAILESAIREGCIDETVSSQIAVAALLKAERADIRAVLEQVAKDEARHADLAWSFVAWMLERQPTLKSRASLCFDRALVPPPAPEQAREEGAELEPYGCLTRATRAAIRARALQELIAPRASQLLVKEPAQGASNNWT